MLEKLVPIPPEFYDDHKDDDLITGKGTIFPFAVFLYFMQWAAFLGFILFYWYHPSFQVMQSIDGIFNLFIILSEKRFFR